MDYKSKYELKLIKTLKACVSERIHQLRVRKIILRHNTKSHRKKITKFDYKYFLKNLCMSKDTINKDKRQLTSNRQKYLQHT